MSRADRCARRTHGPRAGTGCGLDEFEFEFEPADQPGFTQGKGLPAGRSCMSTARYEFLFTVPIADLVRPPEHRNVYQQTVKG